MIIFKQKRITTVFVAIFVLMFIHFACMQIDENDKNRSDGLIHPEPADTIGPVDPPSELRSELQNDGLILLKWNDCSENESGFLISNKINEYDWTLLDSTSANCSTYVCTTFEGNNYSYRVSSYNSTDTSDYLETNQFLIMFRGPSDFQSINHDSLVTLSWIDNSNNEDGYRIVRKSGESPWINIADLPPDCVSYIDTVSFTHDSLFYYMLSGLKAGQKKVYSCIDSIQYVYPILDPPSEFIAFPDSFGVIELKWKDNSNCEDGFIIKRRYDHQQEFSQLVDENDNPIVIPEDSTFYVDRFVASINIPCYYIVYAVKDGILSEGSNPEIVKTHELSNFPPSRPLNMHAYTDSITGKITLAWESGCRHEEKFILYYYDYSYNRYNYFAEVPASQTTFVFKNGLRESTTPSTPYAVRGENRFGTSLYMSRVYTIDYSNQVPSVYRLIDLEETSNGVGIDFSYGIQSRYCNPAESSDIIIIERSVNYTAFEVLDSMNAILTPGYEYIDSNIFESGSYRYRVKLHDDRYVSEYSDIYEIYLDNIFEPLPPDGLVLTLEPHSIRLDWNDNSDNESIFQIHKKEQNEENFTCVGQSSANKSYYIDNSVISGNTYEYKINAINSNYTSDYSEIKRLYFTDFRFAFSEDFEASIVGQPPQGNEWNTINNDNLSQIVVTNDSANPGNKCLYYYSWDSENTDTLVCSFNPTITGRIEMKIRKESIYEGNFIDFYGILGSNRRLLFRIQFNYGNSISCTHGYFMVDFMDAIPMHSWFDLDVEFTSDGHYSVYINDELILYQALYYRIEDMFRLNSISYYATGSANFYYDDIRVIQRFNH